LGRDGNEKREVVVGVHEDGRKRYVALDFTRPPEIVNGMAMEVAPVERECRRNGDGSATFWVKLLQAPLVVAEDDVPDTRILILCHAPYRESRDTEADTVKWDLVGGSGSLLILHDGAIVETHTHIIANYRGLAVVDEKEMEKPRAQQRRQPQHARIRRV
ncbi:hypothetical protein KJ678_01130, partial [Patescibacteria group bacterium]|nr:hypothetical protein [Patescibacteria group bacterium]